MHHLRATLTFYLLVRRLLITLANSLDPDEARRDVGPNLDPNCNADGIPVNKIEKNNFEKKNQ